MILYPAESGLKTTYIHYNPGQVLDIVSQCVTLSDRCIYDRLFSSQNAGFSVISLVLGLGNIGEEYAGTRHNAGFEVVNRLAGQLRAQPRDGTPLYDWYEAEFAERLIVLAKPKTYMNLSGRAGLSLVSRMEIEPSEMLVVVDDYNLPLGALRFRAGGTGGGHNGLESIIEALETENFPRLRLGIGYPADGSDIVDFVLGRFSEDESKVAEKMFDTAAEAAYYALSHRLQLAMSKFNSTPALPE